MKAQGEALLATRCIELKGIRMHLCPQGWRRQLSAELTFTHASSARKLSSMCACKQLQIRVHAPAPAPPLLFPTQARARNPPPSTHTNSPSGVCARMHACMHMCLAHAWKYTGAAAAHQTYPVSARTHMNACTCTCAHTHQPLQRPSCTPGPHFMSCTHTCAHMHMHTHAHTHTCTCARTHAHPCGPCSTTPCAHLDPPS